LPGRRGRAGEISATSASTGAASVIRQPVFHTPRKTEPMQSDRQSDRTGPDSTPPLAFAAVILGAGEISATSASTGAASVIRQKAAATGPVSAMRTSSGVKGPHARVPHPKKN
jgi:hypothetical protein